MGSIKILDTRHTCQNCRFNDGMAYTSNPVKYKCTFDGEYYEGMHPCHLDLAPVVRCKDCKHCSEYAFGISHTPTLACVDVDENGVVKFAVATTPDHFCAKGERRSK